MSVGGKKIPIHIRLTNIENPGDIQEFKSIHCAMKKCKKSFQTIKNYITNKMIVNGFMWEAVKSLNESNSINENIEIDSINENESIILSEEYVVYPSESVKEVFDTNELTNELNYTEHIEELSHIEHHIDHPIYHQNENHKVKHRDQCNCILM
jgi:hypothetical protein